MIFVVLFSSPPPRRQGAGAGFAVREERGAKAPGFTLKDLSGAQKGPGDYKGKVVILHFWASWCEPCKREFPDLGGSSPP